MASQLLESHTEPRNTEKPGVYETVVNLLADQGKFQNLSRVVPPTKVRRNRSRVIRVTNTAPSQPQQESRLREASGQ